MSSSVDDLFDQFVHANDLAIGGAFGEGGGTRYTGLTFRQATKDEVRGSADFAAFVDGAVGNPPKYGGAIGTPKRKDPVDAMADDISRTLGADASIRHFSVRRVVKDGLVAAGQQSPQSRYMKQYELGAVYRK